MNTIATIEQVSEAPHRFLNEDSVYSSMTKRIREVLILAEAQNMLPRVVAYNRIDGPGSSLDLSNFQESFWQMPPIRANQMHDPCLSWSSNLPRTVGITINAGTAVTAHPYYPNQIAAASIDFNSDVCGTSGTVMPSKECWLLKIMDIFHLNGVKFVLKNTRADTRNAGLGGSATATMAVCLLANELAGRPFSHTQLINLASCIEQNCGVSITGAQEQSNVVFGGVTDYAWFPWGFPRQMHWAGHDSGFGSSLRTELIPSEEYYALEHRIAIIHTGIEHASMDVNKIWLEALLEKKGYKKHYLKLALAYQFREGLRLRLWDRVADAIDTYRTIRTELCPHYMTGAEVIQNVAEKFGCVSFPLGAGAGGAALIFGVEPEQVKSARDELRQKRLFDIPVKIKQRGHECFNLEKITELWNSHDSGVAASQENALIECAL